MFGDLIMSETSSQKLPACPAVGSQTATICLPVSIKPYAIPGTAKLECCGKPVIAPACKTCHGIPNGKCDFTISQTIRIDLPVEFGATITTGDTFVDCYCDGDVSSFDCSKLQAMLSEEMSGNFPCPGHNTSGEYKNCDCASEYEDGDASDADSL